MIKALTCIFRVELRGLEPLTPTLPAMSERDSPNPRRGNELRRWPEQTCFTHPGQFDCQRPVGTARTRS